MPFIIHAIDLIMSQFMKITRDLMIPEISSPYNQVHLIFCSSNCRNVRYVVTLSAEMLGMWWHCAEMLGMWWHCVTEMLGMWWHCVTEMLGMWWHCVTNRLWWLGFVGACISVIYSYHGGIKISMEINLGYW